MIRIWVDMRNKFSWLSSLVNALKRRPGVSDFRKCIIDLSTTPNYSAKSITFFWYTSNF